MQVRCGFRFLFSALYPNCREEVNWDRESRHISAAIERPTAREALFDTYGFRGCFAFVGRPHPR